MKTAIPIIVCAKNEARSIGATLEALDRARAHASPELTFDLCVVLDDTTDDTESVVRRLDDVVVIRSTGGKIEAQRAGLAAMRARAAAPWAIFCDADVLPSEDSLRAMCSLLASRPDVQVATCALVPMAPRRRGALAAALHTYNRRRGFSSSRSWFNGKLFAIRAWEVPARDEVAARAASLPYDPFYDFAAGLVVDDVFLSRAVVMAHGPGAIAEALGGHVRFRAPETWRGMNRYYRRMRRELERLDLLFPETAAVHRRHGRRRADLLLGAPLVEKMQYALFSLALASCRAAYVTERAWLRHVRRAPRPFWPPIEETKSW